MVSRALIATRLGFLENVRRPLLVVLLVTVPFLLITWMIYVTEPSSFLITLPGGDRVTVTMKDLHGAIMVPITVAFLSGLVGLFVMISARGADRRLVAAGFRPGEIIVPRLVVILVATVLVLAVSLAVTAIDFLPLSWPAFIGGNLLAGITYALIGALAGALLPRLGAAYLMFFLPMMDIGVAQDPMFLERYPPLWAHFLPGYGSTRVVVDGAFSTSFEALGPLLIGLAWGLALAVAVVGFLRRSISVRG